MNYQEGRDVVLNQAFRNLHYMRTYSSSRNAFLLLLHLSAHRSMESVECDTLDDLMHLQLPSANTKLVQRVFDIFSHELYAWEEDNVFHSIIKPLNALSLSWYREYYQRLFEEILSLVFSSSGREISCFIQPEEVSRLIKGLCEVDKRSRIYNPFAGVAPYGIDFGKDAEYFGQEVNEEIWALGILRLIAHGIDCHYELADSLTNWPIGVEQKFDLIVSTPPFGNRIENPVVKEENLNAATSDTFVLEKGPDLLTEDGRLVVVCPCGFLAAQGRTRKLKEKLVKSDILDSVIILPDDLFPYTKIGSVIVVLSKAKDRKGYVRIVDGRLFSVSKGRKKILDSDGLMDCIQKGESDFVRIISNDEISENDYNLSPSPYFDLSQLENQMPEGSFLLPLSEIVKEAQSSVKVGNPIRIVKGSDLSKDPFGPSRTFEELKLEKSVSKCHRLADDLILVNSIGPLKPTLFSCRPDIEVYSAPTVYALTYDRSIIDPYYLVNELRKEYVLRQIDVYGRTALVQRIGLENLMKIKIVVPKSIDLQRKLFEEERIRFQEAKIKELGIEVEKLHNSQLSEFERNMRLRKHALAQVIGDFSSAFNLLKACKDRHDGILRDKDVVASRTGETVEQYFRKMQGYVEKVEDMVNALVDRQQYGKEEDVRVESFIKNYAETHISDNYVFDLNLNHVADFDLHIPESESEGLDHNGIQISPKDFRQILDNIVTNAQKYGFIDSERKDYAIRIDLTSIEEQGQSYVVIKISNNGAPLPKGMDIEKFFHWGVGNGTGLGNWQVKNIVEHYKGSVRLNLFENDPFSIEYEIHFPVFNRF